MRRVLLTTILAASATVGATACQPSESACASVTAEVTTTAQPGQSLEIELAELFSTCNDEGQGTNLANDIVTVELIATDSRTVLATGTADVADDGTAMVLLTIPENATGALAVVHDDEELATVELSS